MFNYAALNMYSSNTTFNLYSSHLFMYSSEPKHLHLAKNQKKGRCCAH